MIKMTEFTIKKKFLLVIFLSIFKLNNCQFKKFPLLYKIKTYSLSICATVWDHFTRYCITLQYLTIWNMFVLDTIDFYVTYIRNSGQKFWEKTKHIFKSSRLLLLLKS